MKPEHLEGRYEAENNILHVWHPKPWVLGDEASLRRGVEELIYWIKRAPERPYLLIDYANLQISVEITDEFAELLKSYRPLVKGVFRYGVGDDIVGRLTGVAVRLANRAEANIFPDEAAARRAIEEARQREQP